MTFVDLDHLYQTLADKLRAIWDDEEFIIGVLSDLETKEDLERVICYIDAGVGIDPSSIVCFSTEIQLSKNK